MPESNTYDIAVIGGGIVGLATALALVRNRADSLVVLEAEERLASHQTGNNSGVIHSGLYYRPGSLKALNCKQGREALYRFCQEHAIAHQRCGKLVVAVSPRELPRLDDLEKRGRANGLQGLKRVRADELKEYEPHAAGLAGLWVAETGIVDYVQVSEKFTELVCRAGGTIRTGFRVTRVNQKNGVLVLSGPAGEVACRKLINCAGLQADRLARLCGVEPGLRIVPFRGEYYTLGSEAQHMVRHLIYPVPDPEFPFLGVHFTRRIDDRVEAGPNAVLAFKREGYRKTSFSLKDTAELLAYRGFWIMGFKHWRMGLGEFYRSLSKRAFVRALQRLVPEISASALLAGGAGVRAQALDPDGFLLDDFRIKETERMIHVLNAPSPAATASLSIGETVARMALANFKPPR